LRKEILECYIFFSMHSDSFLADLSPESGVSRGESGYAEIAVQNAERRLQGRAQG
jgi:hypothetical protein